MRNLNLNSALLAAAVGLAAGSGVTNSASAFRAPRLRTRKAYPSMVVSPQAEINAWNAAVDVKKAAKRARQAERRAQA